MTEPYAYFVRVRPPEFTVDRPASLWRRPSPPATPAGRAPGVWQYWSTIDRSWYGLRAEVADEPPPSSGLVRVPRQRAAELEADREAWVRYWALYQQSARAAEPTTVVRRRCSPERQLDEVLGSRNLWVPTDLVVRFTGSTRAPRLVEIDRTAAARIMHRRAATLAGAAGEVGPP